MRDTTYTLADRVEGARYMAGVVYPGRLAPRACIRVAGAVASTAIRCGLRRAAISVAIWGYDIADHDPADATWELHREVMPWAWAGVGVFRPTWAMAAAGWWSR